MQDEELKKEPTFQLFDLPRKLLESISDVLAHDTEDHNCRTLDRDRLSWRLNN